MGEVVSTARLRLRPLLQADAERINACVRDPRIYRNVGRIASNQTLEDTRAFIARNAQNWTEGRNYGFGILNVDDLIGVVGGSPLDDGLAMDVGYWIAPDSWGRGFATEAFRAYVDWLAWAKGVRGVTAGHFTDNPASGRVLSKCGFLRCGRSRYYCLGRDEWVDCIDMARIV